MPCRTIQDNQGRPIGFACSRGTREVCAEPNCGRASVALCDFPLSGAKAGTTCDAKMCARHRNPVGRNKDYCRAHLALSRQESRDASAT